MLQLARTVKDENVHRPGLDQSRERRDRARPVPRGAELAAGGEAIHRRQDDNASLPSTWPTGRIC